MPEPQPLTNSEIETWLDANTKYCASFRTRLTTEACKAYQEYGRDQCLTCPDRTIAEDNSPIPKTEGGNKMAKSRPMIICKECGREAPHCARELCKACYQRQNNKSRKMNRLNYWPSPTLTTENHNNQPAAPDDSGGLAESDPPDGSNSPKWRSLLIRFETFDEPLYRRLLHQAQKDRRLPDQQILYLLSAALPEEAA